MNRPTLRIRPWLAALTLAAALVDGRTSAQVADPGDLAVLGPRDAFDVDAGQ